MKKLVIWASVLVLAGACFAEPTITGVTARQRYPWNGKVDISYTVENAGTEERELAVCAIDQTTGVTNVAKSVTGETAYTGGKHHIVWDMSADGLTLVSASVVFAVSYKEQKQQDGLYCVIDLSGGTSAASYPVSYLPDVPAGGWSDDYKTTKLVLRKVNAGTFTMGSPTDELGHDSNETQHQVTLTQDYWMGVFQVTQRQWELVMGTRPSCFNNDTCYAARPVEQVSYKMIRGSSTGAGWPSSSAVDATSFLGVLRQKSGLTLDLPTEAQWEYACRAGTTTALNSGKNLTSTDRDAEMDKLGRYYYNGGSGGYDSKSCDTSAGTANVGSYAPNAWGLYDMHGNVGEWCLDWYGSYSGDATNPKGLSSGSGRVLRGGSWSYYDACGCRSAYRNYNCPSIESGSYGFRLVRTGGSRGVSDPVRIDLTTGTRVANITQLLTCSTEWVAGAGAGATAVVEVDGEAILGEVTGSGIIRWTPALAGEHVLTHKVMAGGSQIGETLTATFFVPGEEKGFVISFVAPNGESSIQAAYFATNRPYGRLPLARREGCTFAGWYTTLDGTQRVGAFDDVLPDVKTLYARWAEDEAPLFAQWDPNHYSAVFNAGGGTGAMDAQPFIYDQTQALTANGFRKTGYSFKGWATNEAGEVVYADKQAVSNLTAEAGFAVALFAKWEQLMDITEEEIEEWVVYDLAPTYKKKGEKAIDYVKRFKERFGDDYTTAFYSETGKTGQDGEALCVYHDYIAGTDPLDKNSQFTADITFDASGKPIVTYRPVLDEDKTAQRIYTTHGKQNLADEWSVVEPGQEADYRFFKVTIQMRPKN